VLYYNKEDFPTVYAILHYASAVPWG